MAREMLPRRAIFETNRLSFRRWIEWHKNKNFWFGAARVLWFFLLLQVKFSSTAWLEKSCRAERFLKMLTLNDSVFDAESNDIWIKIFGSARHEFCDFYSCCRENSHRLHGTELLENTMKTRRFSEMSRMLLKAGFFEFRLLKRVWNSSVCIKERTDRMCTDRDIDPHNFSKEPL